MPAVDLDLAKAAATFARDGFCLVEGLFDPDECDRYTQHFMDLRSEERPGDFAGVDLSSEDPLKRYPRMIHMHRWDSVSMTWATDPRLAIVMTAILGRRPYMVQTMLYFKPAGGRGQALHQDNSYLRAQPGTCLAAWLALDDCDEENGCLQVVPGTHDLPLLCTVKADTSQSFTDVTVPLPEGMAPLPVIMKRGDVLFFNGSVVHGSFPNTSRDRFRRALIGHYLTGDAERVGEFYHPIYTMDGEQVELGVSPASTRCGHWVDVDGTPVVEEIDAAEHDRQVRHE
ncbi:phytanoyl-CoA dioxygenase family protein [Fimbriimonas ginsengisoli]|uniref:Phytanoyl-CoA dioxygenase n=1 Tax=Fimbriimonas ginsengisoli Gsoil 348 TaxID=661478 RepID=A0A068NVM0_FIMGI|nr:phytanoyl-CoA dioxygenase family protein [Fimbriimonas ginsengisoli]AIE86840.1 Phytanoyl-CoA dioxygenase [Fimbriimonas ginsengisoli Gsoil 348]